MKNFGSLSVGRNAESKEGQNMSPLYMCRVIPSAISAETSAETCGLCSVAKRVNTKMTDKRAALVFSLRSHV